MKKLLMFSAALLIAASNVCAQQKAGTFSITPKVGVTVSNFSGKMPASITYGVIHKWGIDEAPSLVPEDTPGSVLTTIGFNESKKKFGFTIGAEAQYQFTDIFGLSFGAFYTQQGASYDTKGLSSTANNGVSVAINNDLKINLNSITVPILANVYVWKGLAVKAGLQPEYAVSKKTSGDVTIGCDSESVAGYNCGNAGIKSFSLSVPVGMSYEYKNIIADLRYNIGVTNLREEGAAGYYSDSSSSSQNRTLSFTVGYKFEL